MLLPRPFLLLALASSLAAPVFATDRSTDAECTALAHLLTFGRPAAATSLTSVSANPLAMQLERHRAELRSNDDARARTARAAWLDAFGRAPSATELQAEAALSLTYSERLQRHLARLHAEPDECRAVIHRAYRLVVQRDAYAEEFDYWRPHGVRSFVVLVACIEDWARRNRPGLMVTAGNPTVPARSRFVTIMPLTPALATEARALLAFDVAAAADASRVLAVGAERVATPGGMHLAIVGRD
jgi:hypothetical protein